MRVCKYGKYKSNRLVERVIFSLLLLLTILISIILGIDDIKGMILCNVSNVSFNLTLI